MFTNGNGKEAKIIKQLDNLAALKYELQLLEADLWKQLDAVIPDEVLQQMNDIKAELQPKIETAQEKIADLEDVIKESVKTFGATVNGAELMAVYSAGRTSWDTKGLLGFAKADKRILDFRKIGDPSASIRAASKKE